MDAPEIRPANWAGAGFAVTHAVIAVKKAAPPSPPTGVHDVKAAANPANQLKKAASVDVSANVESFNRATPLLGGDVLAPN